DLRKPRSHRRRHAADGRRGAARRRSLGARIPPRDAVLGPFQRRGVPGIGAARRSAVEGSSRRAIGDRPRWSGLAAGGRAMKARAAAPDLLISELESARRFLQRAVDPVPETLWAEQPSPTYSPIGWHLGHVASMQSRWLLPGEPQQYGPLFDPRATAKTSRLRLPSPYELRVWLDDVLERVCAGLRAGRIPGILGLP